MNKELIERISEMSLAEKVLQLTQYTAQTVLKNDDESIVTGNAVTDGMSGDMLWNIGSVLNGLNGETVTRIRQSRREKGIPEPVMFMIDVIHGYRTIFPVPLAIACSFDTALAKRCAEMSAVEAKYDGTDVTFSPMVDLCRDARWGRVMESFGEDPYLCGEMGKAFIRGYHSGGIGCCVKHFAAYGACESGRDYAAANISEHTLKEYYLAPYKECLKENPEMFMCSFNSLNGIPMLANKKLLIDVLRKEWGFDGVLISDHSAVLELIKHGYVATDKECALAVEQSGLDIEMCTPSYAVNLPDLVKEGTVPESDVDRLVYRVLELKDKLGLYKNPDRYTDTAKFDKISVCDKHRDIARTAAEESSVLLKNNGVLPLSPSDKIALIGPFADSKEIVGAWNCKCRLGETVTVKEGVANLMGNAPLCIKGCNDGQFDTDESGFEEAVNYARSADVIVACIGENMNCSGEAHSRADIAVPRLQAELIRRLHALGKPIAVVLFGGRPQVLKDIEPFADAILCVWHPGTEGGNAIANLIYGKVNPSGKLAMSFPRSVGQCPIYYNNLSSGRPQTVDKPTLIRGKFIFESAYDDEYTSPLYPFGFGLSYTTFEYKDMKLSSKTVSAQKSIVASVNVKNTGTRDGQEVVQWYIHDKFASILRPVKELKGFEKVFLKAGEQKTVSFMIDIGTLEFYTASGEGKAESGEFELFVGASSDKCLRAEFIFYGEKAL